jgi:Fe-S-cluster containining protein
MAKTTASATRRVKFDCAKCPAFCCSIYERVAVTKRDLTRLARHHGLTMDAASKRFTKAYGKERVLRRKKDPVLGTACRFLDPETRGCTIYLARPTVCREYPGELRCGYYDVLQFERRVQEDPDVIPLIQITFRPRPLPQPA